MSSEDLWKYLRALIGITKPAAISGAFVAYFVAIAIAASAAFSGMSRMLRTA